jgi:hypothetical protein
MSPELSAPPVELATPRVPTVPGSDRELKALLADLVDHSETLVRQEFELGKTELNLRVEKAKLALLHGAISAALYYAAYLTTLACLVLLLAQWVAAWLAALIVALVASAGAAVFTLLGRKALEQVKHPHQTIRSFTGERAHT